MAGTVFRRCRGRSIVFADIAGSPYEAAAGGRCGFYFSNQSGVPTGGVRRSAQFRIHNDRMVRRRINMARTTQVH